jgi:hypothetical protein
VAVAVLLALSALTAASQDASKKEAAKATPTSQDKQAEAVPWQTSWRLYVSELAKQLQNVTFPYFLNGDGGFKNVFVGKWIEFDGVMPTGFVTAHTMNERERRIYAPEIDKGR